MAHLDPHHVLGLHRRRLRRLLGGVAEVPCVVVVRGLDEAVQHREPVLVAVERRAHEEPALAEELLRAPRRRRVPRRHPQRDAGRLGGEGGLFAARSFLQDLLPRRLVVGVQREDAGVVARQRLVRIPRRRPRRLEIAIPGETLAGRSVLGRLDLVWKLQLLLVPPTLLLRPRLLGDLRHLVVLIGVVVILSVGVILSVEAPGGLELRLEEGFLFLLLGALLLLVGIVLASVVFLVFFVVVPEVLLAREGVGYRRDVEGLLGVVSALDDDVVSQLDRGDDCGAGGRDVQESRAAEGSVLDPPS
mmetsp:Transcript_1822/g.6129  ORF Transcript_1822/g.6129 Transcript_1822/m.6129 type:complete len:303 (+) Transcript_1822:641-1549(+)